MNNIGQRIKELRKKNGLTQERLADYLGVTYKAVSKWECGLTMPDLALIVPLARILHVSADELLSGKPEEMDMRRAEFDKCCDNWLESNKEEHYQMALQAASEYPSDYKYLKWLAHMEMYMAYHPNYKEDPTKEYSVQMLERALEHNNIVIAECDDTKIREEAIWNAMICCKSMNRYDDALKYAEMLPEKKTAYTRDLAMDSCLQGERLTEHRRFNVYSKIHDLLVSLSRIYYWAERMEPHVAAALDTTEAILKTVFPDGNYLGFYKDLCCVYEKRAEFAMMAGEYDKAMAYLQIMLNHAQKVPYDRQCYTCGVLDQMNVDFSSDHHLLYIQVGMDDLSKSVCEQLKNRLKCVKVFAPLWEREDFQALVK